MIRKILFVTFISAIIVMAVTVALAANMEQQKSARLAAHITDLVIAARKMGLHQPLTANSAQPLTTDRDLLAGVRSIALSRQAMAENENGVYLANDWQKPLLARVSGQGNFRFITEVPSPACWRLARFFARQNLGFSRLGIQPINPAAGQAGWRSINNPQNLLELRNACGAGERLNMILEFRGSNL